MKTYFETLHIFKDEDLFLPKVGLVGLSEVGNDFKIVHLEFVSHFWQMLWQKIKVVGKSSKTNFPYQEKRKFSKLKSHVYRPHNTPTISYRTQSYYVIKMTNRHVSTQPACTMTCLQRLQKAATRCIAGLVSSDSALTHRPFISGIYWCEADAASESWTFTVMYWTCMNIELILWLSSFLQVAELLLYFVIWAGRVVLSMLLFDKLTES